ncbi:hypothetical protein AYI69_g6563, partial [Smittium culicis]
MSCSRWRNHRSSTIGRFIPTPISSDEYFLLSNFNEARLGLVGKLLGGESKQSLSQLRAGTADQNFELETAKFLNGIRVPRTLILQSISDSPAPLNQCPVGMELLERRRGFFVYFKNLFNKLSETKKKKDDPKYATNAEVNSTNVNSPSVFDKSKSDTQRLSLLENFFLGEPIGL